MGSLRENLALNIKIRRDLQKLSQAQLAEMADVSSGYLGALETCRNWPGDDTAERIARALGIQDPGELFTDPNRDKLTVEYPEVRRALERGMEQIIRELGWNYGAESDATPGDTPGGTPEDLTGDNRR